MLLQPKRSLSTFIIKLFWIFLKNVFHIYIYIYIYEKRFLKKSKIIL